MKFYIIKEKKIWIARVADENSDAYRAFFAKEEAIKQAEQYAAHLTESERKTHTVSVEMYTVKCEDGASAEEAYRDACLEDEIGDPEEYIEV